MSVVNQTVEDAIGDRGIANLLVPARDLTLPWSSRLRTTISILTEPERGVRLPGAPPIFCDLLQRQPVAREASSHAPGVVQEYPVRLLRCGTAVWNSYRTGAAGPA